MYIYSKAMGINGIIYPMWVFINGYILGFVEDNKNTFYFAI